jgi:amino acid adenylation domain-containing protein
MSNLLKACAELPLEQQTIRVKSPHQPATPNQFSVEDVETSIPARFEKIVQLYPDQIAVKTGSHAVTYSELNTMANRVAGAIVAERGHQPEPVGILLEKGIEQMAAMLGILKAGKFFILLDASLPAERIWLVMEDSKAALLFVDGQTMSLTRQDTTAGCKLFRIDTLAQAVPLEDHKISISPHALACVVYTSGSTGRPKGVMRQHRVLLHDAMLRVHTDGISKNDRLAHITAGTANSVTNSFYALLQGTTLVTFDLKREGVARLASWLMDERISICLIASPVFRKLCTTLTGEERFPDLRYLRLRSDTVYGSDVALHGKHFPATCVLATGLASTEAGVLREYRISRDARFSGAEVPVGYALSDKEILLLNEEGSEVGFNEIGEIVVRSKYLSLGYWNDPELTAEKFRADPNDSEKRLYYTDDLGLMLPDGCLLHKGRKGLRVKVRGYGVDLIEVEKTLRSHENIKDAVVIAKHGESGDSRMIAYFALERHSAVTTDELRKFLGAKLPDYMVPSAFVKLAALPLTANGKVDRKALPEPGSERPDLKEPYQSPRNATEKTLAEIWEGLLNVRPVGVHDGFFDLGGDSLTAARLVSEVIKHFQWELSLQQLFQGRTVAEIAAAIDRHRHGEQVENDDSVKLPTISPRAVPRDEQLPLAHCQQGLWFLDQLHPGSFTYNLFSAYDLKGNLDIAALEKSFNEIVKRHQTLRTVFESVDGRPVQVILPSLAIEIPVIDLQGVASEEDRKAAVRRLSREEAQRPFDLARGPLLRIQLLRLAQNEYVLLRTIHHIVFDAWSSSILNRELALLYEAFANGEPSPLADLSIQYADYALWQRQCLEEGVLQSQLSYWRKQLENLPSLSLPTDRLRLSIGRSRGARRYYNLPNHLCEGLRALSRRYGVTLFTIMLAVFQTLLSRQSGQSDIVIGCPVAGRNRSEFDELIGYFLNMIVLRADVSGNPSFAEVIARVWKVSLEALSHQDMPFQKLVEELHPERDLSHHPLVQVVFPFQSIRLSPLQLAGVKVTDLEVETGISRFDLQLEVEDHGDFLKGFVDYNVDLFDAETIVRLLDHFRILLAAVIADPDRRICDVPLLTEAERQKLLVEWNDTKADYPKDKCIHELFEAQVEKTPDAVAVVFEDQQLTYRELNNRANQLAHYLRKHGAGPEVLVGICLERSPAMVTGLLGILKAGAGYVPLDPGYPAQRMEFMLADAGISVLLTRKGLLQEGGPRAEDSAGRSSILSGLRRRICLDEDWELIARQSDANPENTATTDNLAYVIYTSGSTGQPKGVVIEHRNTVAFLSWVRFAFTKEELSGVLASTSICFDLSVFEIFGPLSCGGTIIMAENALALTRIPNRSRVRLVNIVPSAIDELLRLDAIPVSVRVINLAGESLPAELVRRIYESTSVHKVHDLYGPSETTTYSTWTCRSADGRQTIGRPIANTEVYILDACRSPVPIGVAGEIYLGGDGLARGYLNQPELTAERFIFISFDGQPEQRLYKTGDRARYLADGNIEFLGRTDNQVKIRGYRIEPGEIEAALAQHPAVRECAVIAQQESDHENESKLQNPKLAKRLIAYVALRQRLRPTVSELGSFMRKSLPDYMVPSLFVFLDTLPLTANGKVNRQALPLPDRSRPDLENAFVLARTAIEKTLASIWGDILKLDRVGIYDNFFELGGHSLLATQVMSRTNRALRIESPLRTLFEAPTIAGWVKAVFQNSDQLARAERRAQLFLKVKELSGDQVEKMLDQKREQLRSR